MEVTDKNRTILFFARWADADETARGPGVEFQYFELSLTYREPLELNGDSQVKPHRLANVDLVPVEVFPTRRGRSAERTLLPTRRSLATPSCLPRSRAHSVLPGVRRAADHGLLDTCQPGSLLPARTSFASPTLFCQPGCAFCPPRRAHGLPHSETSIPVKDRAGMTNESQPNRIFLTAKTSPSPSRCIHTDDSEEFTGPFSLHSPPMRASGRRIPKLKVIGYSEIKSVGCPKRSSSPSASIPRTDSSRPRSRASLFCPPASLFCPPTQVASNSNAQWRRRKKKPDADGVGLLS